MKTQLKVTVVTVLLILANAAYGEVKGYVEGTDPKLKQAVCWNLAAPTSQPVSLTGDLKEYIAGPSAISGDGQTLVWFVPGRQAIKVRKLPREKPYFAPTSASPTVSGGRGSQLVADIPAMIPGTPGNLCLSAGGNMFAYSNRAKTGNYFAPNGGNKYLLRYPQVVTNMVVCCPTNGQTIDPNPCMDLGMYLFFSSATTTFGELVPHYFPTWSVKGEKLASIYSEGGSNWVKIYANPTANQIQGTEQMKTVQITAQLTRCKGLAWKPDNTITLLADDKVMLPDGTVIAKDVAATRVFWVSNTAFIWRKADGTLWVWEDGGNSKKLLNGVPEEFSYCPDIALTERPTWDFDPAKEVASSGKETVKAGDTILIGNIKTRIGGSNIDVGKLPGQGVLEHFIIPPGTDISNIRDSDLVSYAYIKPKLPGTLLDKNGNVDPYNGMGPVRGLSSCKPVELDIPAGSIAILKLGGRYAAIKPTGSKYEKGGTTNSWLTTYEWRYWPSVPATTPPVAVSAAPN
jgi:hypothetical protein